MNRDLRNDAKKQKQKKTKQKKTTKKQKQRGLLKQTFFESCYMKVENGT